MATQDRLTLERVQTRAETGTLLRVDGLSVAYGNHQVVDDVSFGLRRGESLALIGESGSGKSTIARAVLRLLPQGRRARGVVEFDGQDILSLSERRFRPLRGRRVGFVPQDPGNALNPVRTVGAQAKEAAALAGETKRTVLETFAQVGLDGVVQEAGSTATVFSTPASAYARQLRADVPALNPDRYRHLRGAGGSGDPKIEVSGVTKTFTVEGRALTAVDDVSFSVPAGTTHALVGESGSGKTTTIRLLLGLEKPDRGSITVAGSSVAGRSGRRVCVRRFPLWA
jgi:ABC-type glutathione transport system ATPase component